jgi:integrase
MYERRGKYYFDSPITGKWMPLGADIAVALAKYGKLIGPAWTGRTLSDTIARYKTQITPLPLRNRPRTKEAIDNESRTLTRFDKVFGELHQDELTQQHLYRYIDERIDDRKEFKHLNRPAPSAARHDVRFLKKVLAKGIKWGAGTVNAVVGLEFDPDPVDTRDVTVDEFDIVYAAANERVQIVMDIADLTGLRRKDILKIRVQDVTTEGIFVRQGKTLKPILFETTPTLRAVIDRALALKPDIPKLYLIRNRKGQPYTPRGFGSMFKKLIIKLTRPGKRGEPPKLGAAFIFKNLRRKAATDKAIATSVAEASQMLDHADEKTTRKHYIGEAAIKPKKVRPVR